MPSVILAVPAFLVLMAAIAEPLGKPAIAANPAQSPISICSGQPIPRGYVITSVGTNPNCSSVLPGTTNAYTITRPGQTETVCQISPIPRGYVIISSGRNPNCSGYLPSSTNAYTIRRLR